MIKEYVSPSMKATQMRFRAQLLAGSSNLTRLRTTESNLSESEGLKIAKKSASVDEAFFR